MRTILVVDDNPSVRESLYFLLEQFGYAVVGAEDGPQAIARARAQRIDAAMIDVQMPGMNGFEVCRILRQSWGEEGRHVPVLMITGGPSPELERRALQVGALGLLGKPFTAASLAQQIEAAFVAPPPAPPVPATSEVRSERDDS